MEQKERRERMISTREHVNGNASHMINLIMLIEDDMDHAELIIRTTNDHPIPNQVLHFPDGQFALDYLFRRYSFSDPVPSPQQADSPGRGCPSRMHPTDP